MSFASIQTKVRNISSKSLFFGYLGAHGVRLAPGEEYSQDGDLVAKLSSNPRKVRQLNGLKADLDSVLAIVGTPKDHFYDETKDATKVLQVDNGVITAVDPSYGAYSSSV